MKDFNQLSEEKPENEYNVRERATGDTNVEQNNLGLIRQG